MGEADAEVKATRRGSLLRGLSFALGYIVVVQNASIPVPLKLVFLLFTALIAIASGSRLVMSLRKLGLRAPRGLIVGVAITTVILLVGAGSLIWTPATALDDWVRDALTYIFFPAAVLVAFDFGLAATRREVFTLVWVVGAFGAVAFTVTWLQRRGAEDVNIESFGLASSFVPIPAIAMGLAIFCASKRSRPFSLLGVLLLAGVLAVSGGRTIWIYLTVGLIVACVAAVLAYRRPSRAALLVAASMLGVVTVLAVSSQFVSGIAADRVQWFSRLASNGWAVLTADGSAIERTRAYEWALQLWSLDPIWGRGWGQPFPSVTSGVITGSIFTLDSPLIALVKVGVIGAILLAIALFSCFGSIMHMARGDGIVRLSVWIALAMAAVLLFNGFPLENRGFPIFTFCLIAQAAAAHRDCLSAPASHIPARTARA